MYANKQHAPYNKKRSISVNHKMTSGQLLYILLEVNRDCTKLEISSVYLIGYGCIGASFVRDQEYEHDLLFNINPST